MWEEGALSNPPAEISQARYALWDSIRGIALALMIAFHFCYDLRCFGYVDWDVPNGPGWWQVRYLILTLFLGTVGVSFALAHGVAINWHLFWRRQIKLAIAAVAISLVSVFLFPQSWIYFGILHFIWLAGICCLPLRGRPLLALFAGLVLIVGYAAKGLNAWWPFVYFASVLPAYTEDFVPLFPWLGVVYLGMAAGHYADFIRQKFGDFASPWLIWAGRRSLLIYLVHQPLLFAGFYLVDAL